MERTMERTKFNVDKDTEKRTFDGIIFDSQMEMRFYRDVVLPQSRSGNIKHFELQKKYANASVVFPAPGTENVAPAGSGAR